MTMNQEKDEMTKKTKTPPTMVRQRSYAHGYSRKVED